jgi:DNA-binding winged helix-turn-helix (wHTH) protein
MNVATASCAPDAGQKRVSVQHAAMRLSFDGFEIDTQAGSLIRAGSEVALEKRALDMLCYLALHPDRLVTKDELLSEVWQAETLSDGVLSNAAAKLRKALAQAPGAREPIETVRGRGYRWRAARLSSTHGTAPPPSAIASNLEQPSDPFVGRASVIERLERALDEVARANGQCVLLTGDAGMGKTRTLDELARRARTRGFSVWLGTAYEGGGAPPYWPWVEILRSAHNDLARAMFRRHLAVDSWAISLLAPELVATPAAQRSVDEQATRFRLFDEIARFLRSASGDAPRLIAIDDAHWADDASLELLAHVARTINKHPLMLVVTLREQDATRQAQSRAALARFSRQATELALPGLSNSEVSELVLALGPRRAVGAQLAEALQRRTQGNPFFVRQMLELLAQRGLPLHAESLETLALPLAVRDVLRQRIEALSSATRAVLRMAAAIGNEFDAGLLVELLALPIADVLAALEPAHRKGVVQSDATTPQRFSFGHALLREAIYDELSLLERGALHSRIAHVLAQRPSAADPRNFGEIAHHYLLAVPSELDACVRHCRVAADAARRTLGYETAAELSLRASDKLATEGGDPRLRCELLLDLGTDRFCAGDIRNAWLSLEQGANLAEHIGATDLFARFACRLAAWLEIGGGDEDEVRRMVDRALAAIGDSDADLRAALLAHRAETHFELPVEERRALLDQAAALAAQRCTPWILLEVAQCHAGLPDPKRLADTQRAIQAFRALARQHAHALPAPQRLLKSFAVELAEYLSSLTACDLARADAALERCRHVAEESQLTAALLGVELMEAGRAFGDGRFDDVEAIVKQMSDAAVVVGGFALVWASYAVRLLEARGGLEALAGFAIDRPDGFDELRPTQRMNGTLWLARLNAKLGLHDKARRLLSSIPAPELLRMPVRYGDLGMLCFLAETYEELQDRTAAAELYSQLSPYAALNAVGPTFEYGGAVAHYLGILAKLLGRNTEAAQHFEHAERINRALGMPLQLTRSCALRSGLLKQRE